MQKGGFPGIGAGCLQHTGVVTQFLREAKENRGDLVVLWLDPANAYGSMPPQTCVGVTGEAPCSSLSKIAHPGLLLGFQPESLSRVNNI